MGTSRFAALQTHPAEVLDLTSLTLDEWQRLVQPFEAAFQAQMAAYQRWATAHGPAVQHRQELPVAHA